MPTIKANEKQLSALKDIETALKIVSDINAIFSTHSDVCVSCKEGKGRATKEYSVVLDDGLFLACDSRLKHKAVMRSNLSSAVAGNEGLFNLGITGNGVLCLESDCPREELVEITLQDAVLKVDGTLAVAWSGSLSFTVERSGKTLIGSAASGEGLVNVYRGTGKVLLAPVSPTGRG